MVGTDETFGSRWKAHRARRMSGQRLALAAIASVTLALATLLPSAPAFAGSLLSGYGGPGQGSQAILGSTLSKGPNSGSGSGGGPRVSATSGVGVGASAAADAGSGTPRGVHGGGRASKPAAAGERRGGAGVQGAGGARRADTPTFTGPATSASVGSQPLGLSGVDILWILLALAALGLTGALTNRLARQVG
jgi:hypothetical protein